MSLEPQENTLGVLVGRARRAAESTARRLARGGERAAMGAAFLGLGASVLVGIGAVFTLTRFFVHWDRHPNPLISLLAWTSLIAVIVTVVVATRLSGDQLSDGMFGLFLIGVVTAIGLDTFAVSGMADFGRYATAAPMAVMAVLAVVTFRETRELVVATTILGGALLVLALVDQPSAGAAPAWASTQLTAVALAVLPPLIGTAIVGDFRRLVQYALDRTLVQSTVQAPRFAVGMMASEELARLDLAAEELLESIADGRRPLPLDAMSSSQAASLATELRLHLIEGRRETWLYHAVTESPMLGRAVTLSDPSSLAGLLDTAQRDGLLSAVWLLVSDPAKAKVDRTVTLELGPLDSAASDIPDGKILVPIVVTVTGVGRKRLDLAIWDAIGRVGTYADTVTASRLRLDIDCLVDNPAEG